MTKPQTDGLGQEHIVSATIGFGPDGAHSAYVTWRTPDNTTTQKFVDYRSDSPEAKQIKELILKGRIR